MIHQNGIRFFGRVAFHEEYGLPSDKDESELLGTYFAAGDKTDVLFMCNHGMQFFFYKIQKKIREIELYSCISRGFFVSSLYM